jgi:hypothetical protein
MIKLYTITEDYINGVIPNSNGQPNILFRKGDKVRGEIVEEYIFNKNQKGIKVKPTVLTAKAETPDGKVFIPLTILKETAELGVDENKETFAYGTVLFYLGVGILAYWVIKRL